LDTLEDILNERVDVEEIFDKREKLNEEEVKKVIKIIEEKKVCRR